MTLRPSGAPAPPAAADPVVPVENRQGGLESCAIASAHRMKIKAEAAQVDAEHLHPARDPDVAPGGPAELSFHGLELQKKHAAESRAAIDPTTSSIRPAAVSGSNGECAFRSGTQDESNRRDHQQGAGRRRGAATPRAGHA